MNRKKFLKQLSASSLAVSTGFAPVYKAFGKFVSPDLVNTVTGSIPAGDMGLTLIHEHLLSIFGTDAQEPAKYDEQQVLAEVVPYLKYIKSLGCDTIVDCSAAYFGRNATLLKKIAEKSDLQILINTGIYGAAGDDYVPDYAYQETAEQLAARWVEEFENGIHGTDVKPGFIKIGVDSGPLSDIDAKLVRAAAKTHLDTGLLLQIHTANNPKAVDQQLKILQEEKVKPSAWVWVHAQAVNSPEPLLKAAKRGAWISLDGLRTPNYLNGFGDSQSNLMHHYELLSAFKKNDMIDRVMLSHDGTTFPPEGTAKRPLDVLFNSFIPMLKAGGFSDDEIDQVTRSNPANAFALRIRKY